MRLQYYRVPNVYDINSRGIPRGVVIANAVSDDTVQVAASITAPVDHFSRKRGRFIAERRFAEVPTLLTQEDLNLDQPPAGSRFDTPRFAAMWDFIRYVAKNELAYAARKRAARAAD